MAYDRVEDAWHRGYVKAIAEMELEIIKERQDAYLRGFRDGKDYAFGEVRSVADEK